MINTKNFLSMCTESYIKTKFGIKYTEKRYEMPNDARISYIWFCDQQLKWINDLIFELIHHCYLYGNRQNDIKTFFCGHYKGLISVLIKIQRKDFVQYRSLNFSMDEKNIIYPSLTLNKLGIKNKEVKNSAIKIGKSVRPIFETIHISGNKVKIFCKNRKNSDLFLINIKMLNQIS